MQGPGLQPLASGRWRLVATAPGDPDGPAVPLSIEIPAPVDSDPRRGHLPASSRGYVVTPVVTPDGSFELDVSVDGDAGFDRDLARRARLRARLAVPAQTVRGAVFRFALHALRRVTGGSGRRILFTSDSRGGLEGNLKDVHDRMVARGLDRTYTLQTLFRESVAQRRGLRDRLRLPWLLAGADVIVIDDYQPIIYRIGVDPAVRIVQLWHAAGAFKTVGYSRVGKPGGPDPFSLRAQELHATRSSARTTTSRSMRRRSGSRRRASSRPGSRGWTATSTRRLARRGSPRRAPRSPRPRVG